LLSGRGLITPAFFISCQFKVISTGKIRPFKGYSFIKKYYKKKPGSDGIINPENLKIDDTDSTKVAFSVGNMNYGIPLIIQNHG